MTHLSFFSGIGGIDIAAEWAGFKTVQFVERDQFCQKVLAKNFPGVPIHDDVTTFDGSKFNGQLDLVSAGFPCQPHSLAGKRKASGDERDLWGEVVRVLGESQPTWFLGENVAGLFSSESGHFFGRICNDLALLGYRVGWGSWKASDVGACHQRRRVFIVAYSEVFRRDATQFALSGEHRGHEIKSGGRDSNATDPTNKPRLQTDSTTGTIGSRREPWDNALRGNRGCARNVRSSDWRSWDIKPVVCHGNDDVSRRLAGCQLKALGNAVVPPQAYPILQAIADQIRTTEETQP